MRRRTATALLVLLLAAATACSGQQQEPHPGTAPERTTRLLDLTPCPAPEMAGFLCGRLTVPLDHAHPDGRRLHLPVAVQGGHAPVLLVLTGGPGQGGVDFVPRVAQRLAPLLQDRRLVMIDQRGTGGTALHCPGLQREMGETDLVTPTPRAVEQCSARLGPTRAFYGTRDTVADLDTLRRALGVTTWALDGTSYGTYVAEQYALAHPHRVDHLVLDSVVPQTWTEAGSLSLASFPAVRRVLTLVCREQGCPTDPVADLATLVRRGDDGPALLNLLAVISVVRGDLAFVPRMLHDAVTGDRSLLDGWLHGILQPAPDDEFSQGLHAATLCADQRHQPWGGPDSPLRSRGPAMAAEQRRLTAAQTYPFDPATAVDNGLVQVCRWWGVLPSARPAKGRQLPAVPTLVLMGDHDLSTPMEWARQELRWLPRRTVLVVHGAGHSVQSQLAQHPEALRALERLFRSS
ncbi:MAG TPA: alpha/beta hydrolase [Marmoricola sp.]|nr:alpha/beta hydrolase [Marmoricola sp.]